LHKTIFFTLLPFPHSFGCIGLLLATQEIEEAEMKLSIALSALLITGFVAASTEKASAVVYCQYVEYPAGCVAKPGVVLRPRPAGVVVAPGVDARPVDRTVGRAVGRPVDREIRR
jgi:hypothetical protein